MLIEVKELHDPKPGGKVAHIVAVDGERYQIWPEKLNGAAVGKRYDAEIDTHDYGGRTFKKITKLTPLCEEPTPPMSEKFPRAATDDCAGDWRSARRGQCAGQSRQRLCAPRRSSQRHRAPRRSRRHL
jgi:hypothetical protein